MNSQPKSVSIMLVADTHELHREIDLFHFSFAGANFLSQALLYFSHPLVEATLGLMP
jgi:hypothetical protein